MYTFYTKVRISESNVARENISRMRRINIRYQLLDSMHAAGDDVAMLITIVFAFVERQQHWSNKIMTTSRQHGIRREIENAMSCIVAAVYLVKSYYCKSGNHCTLFVL